MSKINFVSCSDNHSRLVKNYPKIIVMKGWRNFIYWEIMFIDKNENLINSRKSFATLKEVKLWLSDNENLSWCEDKIKRLN